MDSNRIPKLTGDTERAARSWLNRMHKSGLLFCLDDDPRNIVRIANDEPTFTASECATIASYLDRIFSAIGDVIFDLAFDVVSRTFHTRAERRSFKAQCG
jgi:hypothetical protein